MTNAYQTNTKVEWKWGNGKAEGYVRNIYRSKITKTIKDSEFTREGSESNPAYLLEQEDGNKVLKLHSELSQSK